MSRLAELTDLDRLDFDKGGGLLPVVAQHAHTGEVLMLAYADRDALASTLRDGELWLRSRSRDAPWRKGETSGNVLRVLSLHADCDADAVLARVVPAGPACHTGATSCFAAPPTLAALAETIAARAATTAVRDVAPATGSTAVPGGAPDAAPAAVAPTVGVPASYTRRLLADENLRLKKLGEEAVELALACSTGGPEAVAGEAADLLYHLLVACAGAGVPLASILARLEERRGGGGG
jgi:phosphoribosyl-AMP cyclohydrolase / phosphoribosyl-ATP pyrophosphohydrolase